MKLEIENQIWYFLLKFLVVKRSKFSCNSLRISFIGKTPIGNSTIKAWFGSLLSIIKKGHCSSWYSMDDFVAWFCCFWNGIFSLQKHDKECYTHVSSSLEAHSTLFSQENLSQKPLLTSPRSLLKQFSLLYFYASSKIYPWDWSSSFSFASTTQESRFSSKTRGNQFMSSSGMKRSVCGVCHTPYYHTDISTDKIFLSVQEPIVWKLRKSDVSFTQYIFKEK